MWRFYSESTCALYHVGQYDIFSFFSEFYLQFLESSTINNILFNRGVKGYFQYVDDILIVNDEDKTNIDIFLEYFNNISPKLKFTAEKETESKTNFLDVTVTG